MLQFFLIITLKKINGLGKLCLTSSRLRRASSGRPTLSSKKNKNFIECISTAPQMNPVYKKIKLGDAGNVSATAPRQLPPISRDQILKQSLKESRESFGRTKSDIKKAEIMS